MIEHRGETAAISLHRKSPAVNLGPAERGLSAAAGLALLAGAAALRSRSGLVLALGGVALAARGATGWCPVYQSLGVGAREERADERTLTLVRTVTIGGTPDEIAGAARATARWLSPELESQALAPGRWRAALELPGRRRVETDVEARHEDDGTFAWRSEAGAPFEHQGRVFFAVAPDQRGTEVRVVVSVRAPGGAAGALALRPIRAVAERALGHALRRLKQLVETNEVATAALRPPPVPRTVRAGAREEAAA